jgi:serine/threonine protein kinase
MGNNFKLDARQEGAEALLAIMAKVVAQEQAPLGALKVLHPIADSTAATKARERMAREVEVLKKLEHPALVRILEANPSEQWFVMEYFGRGTLEGHLGRTRGELLTSLARFRPLVEATAKLHGAGFVHRDIKPGNIFVRDDDQLVLGDFGLVINPQQSDPRLTDTYENVGSRDWMPGWAMGMRREDVRPTFDVFGLGKVLWSLVSGRSRLQLWYHHDPEFELETMFPGNRAMPWARRILDKCIVERERDCLPDAGKVLAEVDLVIDALTHGAQVLGNIPSRCWVCGIGEYTGVVRDDPSEFIRTCNYCGHMQSFAKNVHTPEWQP